ncbi:MAG: hypothetical protein AAF253_04400 [Pseudomonadota bacterium]
MTGDTHMFVIDAYGDPTSLSARGVTPPAIVATLRAIQRTDPPGLAAPVILCDGDRAARARGALVVSGDTDGTVIVLPPGLDVGDLAPVAAAWAWRADPSVTLCLVRAGDSAETGAPVAPHLICEDEAFHPSQLGGCVVPTEWLLLAIKTGDHP